MNKAIITAEDLKFKYVEEHKPMHLVAKELGVAVGSVYNYIRRYGIQARPPHQGMKGKTFSEETRKKISAIHKGKKVSAETKEKLSKAHKKHFDGITSAGHKKKHFSGYVLVYAPEHPRATKDGYVFEHTLVMERFLDRHLKEDEVTHHINHNRSDNSIKNLKLMNKKEHQSFHMRLRAIERRLLNEYQ